jgi:hypothetical protein
VLSMVSLTAVRATPPAAGSVRKITMGNMGFHGGWSVWSCERTVAALSRWISMALHGEPQIARRYDRG